MFKEPDRDCGTCPRLVELRTNLRNSEPDWHNAPVPAFGTLNAELLIVGLAPGLRGANRTGRPFTGDFAGDLLYATLCKFGFAEGAYGASPEDGLTLTNCRITNAVRCLPPENKPVGAEVNACRDYLTAELAAMKNLKVIVALGVLSHGAVARCLGVRLKTTPFQHGAQYALENGRILADSYHCSRYNTNTGRLTTEMFEEVFAGVRDAILTV